MSSRNKWKQKDLEDALRNIKEKKMGVQTASKLTRDLFPAPKPSDLSENLSKNLKKKSSKNSKEKSSKKSKKKSSESSSNAACTPARKPIEKPKREKTKIVQEKKAKRAKLSSEMSPVPSTSTESWYCFICDEDRQDDMRCCVKCKKYVHEICVGLTKYDNDQFTCPCCD